MSEKVDKKRARVRAMCRLTKCTTVQSFWHPKIGPLCEKHFKDLSADQKSSGQHFLNRKERVRNAAINKKFKRAAAAKAKRKKLNGS